MPHPAEFAEGSLGCMNVCEDECMTTSESFALNQNLVHPQQFPLKKDSQSFDQINQPSEQQNINLINLYNEQNQIGHENFKACFACSSILGTNMPCLGPPFHDGSWRPPWTS